MKQEIQVNTPLCTGCRLCELVCSVFHEGVVNLEKARIRVRDNYAQSLFEPHICQLCSPPDCVEACPTEALSQDPRSGLIRVDEALCNGCEACVVACPHQAIRWNDELGRLFVCDRCGGEPACVPFCSRGANSL